MNQGRKQRPAAGRWWAWTVVIAALLAGPRPASAKTFLWKVTSSNRTAYLLGSIHLARPDMYPLDPAINKAFADSDVLVVEANINQANPLAALARAMYPADDALSKHIPDADLRGRVRKALGDAAGLLDIERYKPWFLAQMLAMTQMLKLGFDPRLGIDRHFINRAGERPIEELEGLEFQMKLFESFDDAQNALFLESSLKSLDRAQDDLKVLVKAWQGGDTERVEAIVFRDLKDDARLKPVYDKLIFDRNRAMADRIEDYLRTGKTPFIVVGAAHLVGEKGLVRELEKRRYRVQQQ